MRTAPKHMTHTHMATPLVTVITPLYNYAGYIATTVRSVLSQTWRNFEYLIVDDGSDDASLEAVGPFTHDARIKVMSLGYNRGYSVAKNVGIKASRGEYITTIDADDMLTPHSLEVRTQYLLDHPMHDVVHGKVYTCYGQGDFTLNTDGLPEEPCGGRAVRDHIRSNAPAEDAWNTINAQGVLCRRSVYERVGLYDEEMRWKADREMWYRMLHNGCSLGYVAEYVALYRHHANNMSQSEERRRSNIEELFVTKCSLRDGRLPLADVEKLEPLHTLISE